VSVRQRHLTRGFRDRAITRAVNKTRRTRRRAKFEEEGKVTAVEILPDAKGWRVAATPALFFLAQYCREYCRTTADAVSFRST
jgi:hypothetical protein